MCIKKISKSILMYAIALLLSFMLADTAKAETGYGLYICGEKVTNDNMSGEGWRFEPASARWDYNKLYLTNANLVVDNNTLNPEIEGQAIDMYYNLEIILSGDNVINMNATDLTGIEDYFAIYGRGIIISGDGSLTIKGKDCEVYDVDSGYIEALSSLEVKENVKLNLEGMTFYSMEDQPIYCGHYGMETYKMTINSNAQINITGFGVDSTLGKDSSVDIVALSASYLDLHENAKINISLDEIKADRIRCRGMISEVGAIDEGSQININIDNIKGKSVNCLGLTGYVMIIVKNAEINLNMKGIEAEDVTSCGLHIDTEFGNNSVVSVELGDLKCKSGASIGAYGDEFLVGDNCKFTIKGGILIGDYEEDSFKNICFAYKDVLIGDKTIVNINAGNNVNVGCLVNNYEVGVDSCIKTKGSKIAFASVNTTTPGCPGYGGDKSTDLYKLEFLEGRVMDNRSFEEFSDNLTWFADRWGYDLSKCQILFNGETVAKYAEIGPLITIKFNANGGTVKKNSITANNGHAIGTLPTPTRTSYTFTGWYTAKSGGTKVTSTSKLTKSVTLYARWKVTKPEAMTGFTYKSRTASAITLKWTKNTSATGYLIQQYKNGAWFTIKTITKNSTVSYKVSDLTPSTTYKFRIVPYKAVDGEKAYGKSQTQTVKTLPSTVKNFTYSARTSKSITLKWDKNTSADGYVIEQYKGGKWVVIKRIYKNDTVSHKVTGLKSGTTYKFRIKAYKKDGSKKLYSLTYTTKSVKTK